ncbi:DNA topoisomerase 3-alpha [Drosophila takahashii]|uniref:DNA topoisomerase 3-alpha n=1 Tax=Drosophila takahashii TaxID=29030 RepID=UPI001CF863F5|nr:DNA topoisomerase 3-alpha [Drosophila takahashii]
MKAVLKCFRPLVVAHRCYCANPGQQMKFLNVAEKNDAAKTIAGLLSNGAARRREGYSVYNKVFDFEAPVRGQNAKMVMTSVSGHLMQLEFQVSYRNWRVVDPRSLFDAPIKKSVGPDYEPIKRTLEREVRGCQGLIVWTDCDREGENIGYEIINVCRAIKPNLTVYRATFSEITTIAVRRALQQLGQPDKRQSDAVDVRSELDLRTGAAITRFQTMRLQRLFPEKIADKLISYGSCQIPTLGFVAERYKEVEAFVSEPFWKIKVLHTIDDLTVEFNWARNRLFDKEACENYLLLCLAEPAPRALVESVTVKPKHKWRPTPLDTVEMEKLGSRKLKLSAKETMTIAEKLYSKGFISYPRTETNQFSKDFALAPLVEMQMGHRDWGAFAQRVIEWGPNPRNGNKSDQAHPPIHPTKLADNLQGNEARVYELVVRHFLACVSKDAVGSETLVHIDIAGEKFTANGLVIHERNYLDVYVYDKWSAKQIHHYENGQRFEPTEVSLHEGATTAPPLLTEADLIALMEKHGIGTDATHAEHINTIKERGYIGVLDKGFLVPGVIGMGLYEGYDAMELALAKPQLRAEFESDLKLICQGQKDPKVVLTEQIAKYKHSYQQITDKITAMDAKIAARINETPAANSSGPEGSDQNQATMQTLFQCPKCNEAPLALKAKKNQQGWFIGCNNFPDCKNVVWMPAECKDVSVLDECCPNCGDGHRMLKFRLSTPYYRGVFNTPHGWYKTCLPCDNLFRTTFNINLDSVKRVGGIVGEARGGGWGPGPGGGGGGGGGGGSGGGGGGGGPGGGGGSSGGWGSGSSASSGGARKNPPPGKGNKTDSGPKKPATKKPSSEPKPKKAPKTTVNKNPTTKSSGRRSYFTSATSTNELDGFFDSNDGFEDAMLAAADSVKSSTSQPKSANLVPLDDDIAAAFAADDDAEFEALVNGGNVQSDMDKSLTQWVQEHDAADDRPMVWGSRERASLGTAAPTPPPKPAAKRPRWDSAEWDTPSATAAEPETVLCTGCQQPARQNTVRKDGPNQGRLFYKCPKPDECNFFQWADEPASSTARSTASSSSWGTNRVVTLPSIQQGNSQRGQSSMRSNSSSTVTITQTKTKKNDRSSATTSQGDGDQVMCNCGQVASSLTVRKDGPNQGRPFFSCPTREKSCGFFKWGDDEQNQGASSSSSFAWGSGNRNPPSRSQPTASTSDAPKSRRCGLCRKEGHTRNKCPRKNDFDM